LIIAVLALTAREDGTMFQRVCAALASGCSLFLLLQTSAATAASDIGNASVVVSAAGQADATQRGDALVWLNDDINGSAAPLVQRQIRLAAVNPLPVERRQSAVQTDPAALPPKLTLQRGMPSLLDTVLMLLFGSALIAYPLIRKQRTLLRSAVTAM
jgi:hypothetical protein